MKLGILFGGASYEHEISIITAYQLKKRLEKEYELHLIYFTLGGDAYDADQMKLEDFKLQNFKKLKKLKLSKWQLDAVVGAMHGENGEDGLAALFCKLNHLKYLGCDGVAASISMDKYRSYLYLNHNGIPMIETSYYTYEDYLNNKPIDSVPCILKPLYGGSSIGIEVVLDQNELDEKLSNVFQFTKEIIVQPYLKDFEEYNLALNEKSFSNLEKINKKDEIFSFDNKYSDSFKVMHQSLIENELYDDFCEIARKAYLLLGAKGIIRMDFFLVDGHIYLNEVNTTPGALSMYLFPNFEAVFKESLNRCFLEKNKKYPNMNFLLKNNINK